MSSRDGVPTREPPPPAVVVAPLALDADAASSAPPRAPWTVCSVVAPVVFVFALLAIAGIVYGVGDVRRGDSRRRSAPVRRR